MFTSLQQKDISGFLTYLWQADPFKAKWSILAKAYSIIRDTKGKENAPLDSFLAISVPYIGVIPPGEYLAMLGWKVWTDDHGQTTLTRDSQADTTTFDQDLLITNLSVNDIIRHSYHSGYISSDEGMISVSNESTMTMATTAQPINVSDQQQSKTTQASIQTSDHSGISTSPAPATPFTTDQDGTAAAGTTDKATGVKDFEKDLIEAMLKDMDGEAEGEEVTNHAVQLGNNVLGKVLLESGDEFPFNNQFDPVDPTNLHYDPFMGDSFNPFDMSDYLNDDVFGGT